MPARSQKVQENKTDNLRGEKMRKVGACIHIQIVCKEVFARTPQPACSLTHTHTTYVRVLAHLHFLTFCMAQTKQCHSLQPDYRILRFTRFLKTQRTFNKRYVFTAKWRNVTVTLCMSQHGINKVDNKRIKHWASQTSQ